MTREVLDEAMDRLGLAMDGPVRVGVNAASVSAPAVDGSGHRVWVRVAPVLDGGPRGEVWIPADAPEDADRELGGRVPMPRLLDTSEWDAGERVVRARVFELVPRSAISTTPEIATDPAVPDAWWTQLRDALDVVTGGPASEGRPPHMITMWVKSLTGEDVDPGAIRWTAAHGDLHWANLYRDPLLIADWEGYSLAPVGFDPALLLMYSLGHEPTAERVEVEFADVLSGPNGRLARLYAAAEVMTAVDAGHHTWLGPLILRHVASL